ncbi:MAG TPA: response regulator transcription factor [Dehalococcoidia bacterium]|nr:response regulator transcription factor [Dehalococcoidia bacterium]
MADEGAIRVVIVDDHAVVREGLRTYLELSDEIEVVGEARNGREAVDRARQLKPDVMLMDLLMPEMDGIAATRGVKEVSPETNVIVLTSFTDDEHIMPALRAGATGYLLKDVSATDLVRAIEGANKGQAQLHPEVARKLMEQVSQPAARQEPPGAALTPRELEVLRLIASGMSNKEIARELVLNERTVKGHVSNILSKLGLADRTQAALYAVRERIVPMR